MKPGRSEYWRLGASMKRATSGIHSPRSRIASKRLVDFSRFGRRFTLGPFGERVTGEGVPAMASSEESPTFCRAIAGSTRRRGAHHGRTVRS